MGRGQKTCENCGATCGPRTKVCKECGYQFSFKPTSKEKRNTKIIRDFPWTQLEKGDVIKCSGGPYYMQEDGETLNMGERGKFKVEGTDQKGILAWGLGKSGGFCHIYMGTEQIGDENHGKRYVKIPHRVHKLQPKKVRV